MILQKIILKNFLSHKNTEIDFNDHCRILLDGNSGAGKSSIPDGLTWALFNKGRSDNRSLIKRGASAMSVQVFFKMDGKEYRIDRQVTKAGKHTVVIAEKNEEKFIPCKVNGTTATQEFIEKLIGSSYLLFINSAVYPQNSVENFIEQTAVGKKDIIMEIIKAKSYDEYYDKAKAALQALELKQGGLTYERDNASSMLSFNLATISQIPQFQKTSETLVLDLVNIEADKKTLEEKKNTNDSICNQIIVLKTKRDVDLSSSINCGVKKAKLEADLAKCLAIDLNHLRVRIAELTTAREQLQSLAIARDARSEWNAKKMAIMSDRPNTIDYQPQINSLIARATALSNKQILVCPSPECPYKHFAEERDAELASINVEITGYLAAQKTQADTLKAYEEKLSSLESCPDFNVDLYTQVKNQVDDLTRYELELAGYSNLDEKISSLNADILQLNNEQIEYEKGVEVLNDNIKSLTNFTDNTVDNQLSVVNQNIVNKKLEMQKNEMYLESALNTQKESAIIESKLKVIEGQLSGSNADKQALEAIKEALGNKGVKAVVIDYIIPQLEDKINEVLAKLSDFHVALETQKEGVGGDTVLDGLFITVTNGQGEQMDFSNFSGGERLKISSAITEGLAGLQKINFHVLDESVSGLDASTIESFSEVLLQIQSRFNQVICISHLQQIKDLFSERILVEKIDGDSVIKV